MIHDMIMIYSYIHYISYISISNTGNPVLFHMFQHMLFSYNFCFFVFQLYHGTAWKHLYNQPLWEDDPL